MFLKNKNLYISNNISTKFRITSLNVYIINMMYVCISNHIIMNTYTSITLDITTPLESDVIPVINSHI